MATWMERMVHRVRNADTNDAALQVVGDYMGDQGGTPMDENGDQHIHLHLDKGGGGGGMDADPDPMNGGGGDPMNGGGGGGGTPDLTQLAGRVAQLEEVVQQLLDGGGGNGGEDQGEEVELEDPETKDARRYTMRRGKSLRVRDEEPPVPDRLEEMLGETDLPGVEDLDAKMSTGDKLRRFRSGDSADMEGLWSDTIALAEVITPGVRVPTFDARLAPARTATRLCAFRRQTLDRALKDEHTATVLADLVGIRTADQVKSLGCDTVKMAFNATGNALKSQFNSQQMTRSVSTNDGKGRDTGSAAPGPITIAEIQRRNREAWSTGEFKNVK